MSTATDALNAIRALREWVKAVPQDTPLPAMPGIDGDWLDEVEAALAQEPAQQTDLDKVNAQIKTAVDENFGRCPNEKWFSDLLDLRSAYERQLEVGVKK